MRVKTKARDHRKVTRANIYKQYTEVMKSFDVLAEYISMLPVDDVWKRDHLPNLLIEWLKGRDTEGWKGVDSLAYNTLWEVMEKREQRAKDKEG